MAKERTEMDEVVKMQAEQAAQLQRDILDARPWEEFSSSGLPWLKENVFAPMEKELLYTIRDLKFVPDSIAQFAHVKGQLEVLDRIEGRILGRIQKAKSDRARLEEIANSTPEQG